MSQEDDNLIARLRRASELEAMRFRIIDVLDAYTKTNDRSGYMKQEVINSISLIVR